MTNRFDEPIYIRPSSSSGDRVTIQEYLVWTGHDQETFVDAVNEYLEHGWRLHGGVSVCITSTNHMQFAQALCRYKAEESNNE